MPIGVYEHKPNQGFQKGHKLGIGNQYAKGMKPNSTSFKKGQNLRENHPRWNNGIQKQGNGYIRIFAPEHPFCNKRGCVSQHRLVMEKHLGRYLDPKEVVHHINEIKDDNRIENLMLFENDSVHISHHHALNKNCNKQEKLPSKEPCL